VAATASDYFRLLPRCAVNPGALSIRYDGNRELARIHIPVNRKKRLRFQFASVM
jgi:hypothetical protein